MIVAKVCSRGIENRKLKIEKLRAVSCELRAKEAQNSQLEA